MNLADRFWSKVARRGPDECWVWQAGVHTSGYGRIAVSDGRAQPIQYAHRIAWEFTNGSPGGLHVLHRCDNPPCCNPAHLFLGTHADNMRDKHVKGRHNPARGSKNGMAKLSESKIADIWALHAEGWSQRRIAVHVGVGHTTVGAVLRGQAWRRNAA